MATILTRETTAAGVTNLNRPLTNAEGDANLINLNNDKLEVNNPTFTGTISGPNIITTGSWTSGGPNAFIREYTSGYSTNHVSGTIYEIGRMTITGSSQNISIIGELRCGSGATIGITRFIINIRSDTLPAKNFTFEEEYTNFGVVNRIKLYHNTSTGLVVFGYTPNANAQNAGWNIRVQERGNYSYLQQVTTLTVLSTVGLTEVLPTSTAEKVTSTAISAPTFNATSITNGGFQGIAEDTVAAPSFTWTGSLTDGMYRAGTNTIGFTTNGVNRLSISTTNITPALPITNNNVIGSWVNAMRTPIIRGTTSVAANAQTLASGRVASGYFGLSVNSDQMLMNFITTANYDSSTNTSVSCFRTDTAGNVTAAGTVTGTRLISTVAIGTAPLTVTSTTVVPNLNADNVDGWGVTSASGARWTTLVNVAGDGVAEIGRYLDFHSTSADATDNTFRFDNTANGSLTASGTISIGGTLTITGTTKTGGHFYAGTTAPTLTNRLNYDGYLYATRFYGDGSQLTGVSGGISYTRVTANITAVDKGGYIADTTGGAFTITLPATPSSGAQVVIVDGGNWLANNLTVARNGSTIEGAAENLILDVGGVALTLIFDGTTWQTYVQAGVDDSLTTINRVSYTATASQTTFNINYSNSDVEVYLNGVKLVLGDDYTATNGTTIVLATGAGAGDSVDLVGYEYVDISNVVTPAGNQTLTNKTFSNITNFTASGTQILLKNASGNDPTVIHRVDGAAYYILLSNAGTSPNSTWNALRPLAINLTNGFLASENGQIFTGGTEISGRQMSNIVAVAALDIDCSLGNYFTKTINGNSIFTVSNVPASRAYAFTLELTHTSGTVTWFSGVQWPNQTAPTLTTGRTHLFTFVTDDGGTRWRGVANTNYTT